MPLIAASAHLTAGYLNRSIGAVALVLLTLVLVLGVLNVSRLATPRWPRFVIHGLHRNVALLAVTFITLHVATSVFDGYQPISLLYAVIPIHNAYTVVWLGLGAVSFDLVVAVLITSLVRARLGYRAWRAIHWLSYVCWPIAVAHTLGMGNDLLAGRVWVIVLTWVCIGVAVTAVAARIAWAPLARLPPVLQDVGAARHHSVGASDAHPRSGQLRQGGRRARRVREGGQT